MNILTQSYLKLLIKKMDEKYKLRKFKQFNILVIIINDI